MTKLVTYAMTDRPPVRVNMANWRVIATGFVEWHDGQFRAQAIRWDEGQIEVLKHTDGRVLIVGHMEYGSLWHSYGPIARFRAGVLLPADTARRSYAILRAIQDLQLPDTDHVRARTLKIRTINALPPEALDP